jgi:predicted RNA-binding protein YlxR (DUF448 family)
LNETTKACRTLERSERADAKRTRTCVGCGKRDEPFAMVRLTAAGGEVLFDERSPRGRGAHLHPLAACIRRAPRGLVRAFKGDVRVQSGQLGERLVAFCERRMVGLLLAARRRRALAIGTEAATLAMREGAHLALVAVDAGSVCRRAEVEDAIAAGRAIAWKTKSELGDLLGVEAVALCAVRDPRIATELSLMRSAVDAATAATREGVECSPEAR